MTQIILYHATRADKNAEARTLAYLTQLRLTYVCVIVCVLVCACVRTFCVYVLFVCVCLCMRLCVLVWLCVVRVCRHMRMRTPKRSVTFKHAFACA